MNLTKEQLDIIEQMSSFFFLPEDIAINIEVDVDDFKNIIASKSGDAYIAFKKGIIKTELELRAAIKQAATNGSSPAQTLMLELLRKLNTEI